MIPHYPTLPEHAHVATQPLALHLSVGRVDENAQGAVGDLLAAIPQDS